jgi:hypothetical protein
MSNVIRPKIPQWSGDVVGQNANYLSKNFTPEGLELFKKNIDDEIGANFGTDLFVWLCKAALVNMPDPLPMTPKQKVSLNEKIALRCIDLTKKWLDELNAGLMFDV